MTAPQPPRDGEVCPNCHGSRMAMCGLPCDTCLDTGTRAGYERWKGVVPAAPSEPPVHPILGRPLQSGPCPTCSGPSRETVGMVCQTCGTDYAARPSADTETLRRVETLCVIWETEADGYSAADHRDKAVDARRRAASLRAALDAR